MSIPPPSQMSLKEFKQYFGTEKKCHEALIAMRWPRGFECPKCRSRKYSYCQPRQLFQCTVCRTQTSIRAGSVFHKSRISLKQWFYAIYLIAQSDNQITHVDLSHHVGVDRNTIASMRHKLSNHAGPLGVGGAVLPADVADEQRSNSASC